MFKKVVKNTTILRSGILTSRILGFFRDVLIAKYFGTSAILEAFIVAFRIPNLLRSIFGEGFSDSVAVPVLSEQYKDEKRLFQITNRLISLFSIILVFVTALGILFAKYLVMAIAFGFIEDPFKFNMAVSFTRITFFYLLLIGAATNLNALLYVRKRFFVPAFSSCFLNLSFIVGLVFFRLQFRNIVLVLCVVSAGIVELLFSYFFVRKEGFKFIFSLKGVLKDSAIIKMSKLFLPRVWSAVVYHLNVYVDTFFSSLGWIVGQGGVAAIYYANRIIQFPLALIALSVSRVAIVDFSRFHKDGNMDDFKKLFVFSFQNILTYIIPISLILLSSHEHIIKLLFFRGDFDSYSLAITSSTLFFYSFGLLFFCGIKIFVNAFYALKDTATPAKITTISLVINAVLNACLMFPLGIGGIALASSISATVNFFLLYYALKKKVGSFDWSVVRVEIFKLFILGALMAIATRVLFSLSLFFVIKLVVIVAVDCGLFIVLGTIFNIQQIKEVSSWIKKLVKK